MSTFSHRLVESTRLHSKSCFNCTKHTTWCLSWLAGWRVVGRLRGSWPGCRVAGLPGGPVAVWPCGCGRWAGGRVAGWPGGRVAGWPGGRVAGWPGGRLAGWAAGRLAGWPGGRVAGWPAGRVAGWPGGRVTRWLGGRGRAVAGMAGN